MELEEDYGLCATTNDLRVDQRPGVFVGTLLDWRHVHPPATGLHTPTSGDEELVATKVKDKTEERGPETVSLEQ